MKVSTTIFIASTAVLVSTIYARPALFKRAKYLAEAIACFTPILLDPLNSSRNAIFDCQSKLGHDLGLIKGATVTNLEFDLGSDFPSIASSDIKVEVVSFTGLSSLPISRAKLDDGSSNAGSFESVWLSTTHKGFLINMVLPATRLTITTEQTSAFIALLTALATTESHAIVLAGTTDVDLSVAFNDALNAVPKSLGLKARSILSKPVPITGLGITVPITLKGFNNFGGVVHGHLDTAVQTSASGERLIQGQIVVNSPTDILVELGNVDFQLWSKDAQPEYVGIVSVVNMNVGPGTKTYDVIVKVDAAGQLDKYFPVKTGLTLSVRGFAGSSKHPIAADVLVAVKFDLVL
ncbi:hypothetical protein EMPS_11133 [Entomortierella parvispora]|uniref:Uncharacterized protein n=1 Tax=Entomortierella parvispora TaxID=205924 RepID=A0A9P3M1U7_9FUNG|nr:hypothetical protein EMPS_11133 [Entomortierella parvispora]